MSLEWNEEELLRRQVHFVDMELKQARRLTVDGSTMMLQPVCVV
jgi:hypothetical protein